MSKKIRYIVRALLTFVIGLTLILAGYETFLMLNGDKTYLYVLQQEIIAQEIAKDAMIMQYQVGGNKTIAVSDLSTSLNIFETNESLIVNGNNPNNIVPMIQNSTVDYEAIDIATRKILSTPDKPADSVEVQIIQMHQRSFSISYKEIENTLAIDETNYIYAIFFTIIVGKILILFVCLTLLFILEKYVPTTVDKLLSMTPDDIERPTGGLS